MNSPRSWMTPATALLAVALLGFGLALPWYVLEESKGRTQSPEAAPKEPVTEYTRYGPYVASDTGETSRIVRWSGLTAIGSMGLALLIELVFGAREFSRRTFLALACLSLLATITALAWAWFQYPASLEDRGVNEVFTQRKMPDGYIRSGIEWGWSLVGLASFAIIGSILAKFGWSASSEIPGANAPAPKPRFTSNLAAKDGAGK